MNEIVGTVDIPAEFDVGERHDAEPEAVCFGLVLAKRCSAVGEPESAGRRNDTDVGSVAVPIRHQGHGMGQFAELRESGRQRQVAVGDENASVSQSGQCSRCAQHGAIEAGFRAPQHVDAKTASPGRDVGVVAHNKGWEVA